MKSRLRVAAIGAIILAHNLPAASQPLPVRHVEGTLHGFLAVRDLEGKLLAHGDLTQTVRGDRVTSRVAFQFRDGSVHEETVVFSQRGTFRLISDHVSQKGPSFPRATDIAIDAVAGTVQVKRSGESAKDELGGKPITLPAGLANGLVSVLVKNIPRGGASLKAPIVTVTSKPHLADLTITRDGEDEFTVGGSRRKAARYVIHLKFRGVSGVVAPLLGKEPPDYRIWVLEGAAPVFLRSEGPLYQGGPVWRIELASPEWPKEPK
jgi:hypothetical protein